MKTEKRTAKAMKAKTAHITTASGHPLCTMGIAMDMRLHDLNLTCGHTSVASAKRAVRKLKADGYPAILKVVEGSCPAGGGA